MATEILTAERKPTTNLTSYFLKGCTAIFESNSRLWMVAFLGATDLFSLFASAILAMQIRQIPAIILEPSYLQLFALLAITLVIMLARKGLYPAVGLNYVDELRLIVSSTSFAFAVILGVTFLLKTTSNYSRLILVITWLLSLGMLPACRYLMRRFMIRLQLWGEPVVIIGNSHKVLALAEHFTINLQLGLRPVAVLEDDHCYTCALNDRNLDPICSIKAQARGMSLQTALVIIDNLNDIDLLAERFRTIFHRVILIKDKNGRYSLNSLEALDFSNILGLQVKNNLLDPWTQALKRFIDVVVSFLGLIFLTPFLGLIALCIYIDSPGRVFYRQMRLGRDGKAFKLLKFRTMHLGAAQVLQGAMERDPALKMEWDTYQKLKNDPRITRVGKFLRKFSLDELPQLWNIAKGQMSLVGPRPMMLDQCDLYGEAYGNYIQVTPGMTGLWQVSGRNQTTFARRSELDDEYIQRWSMWLDIYILVKTIKVVIWEKGAY